MEGTEDVSLETGTKVETETGAVHSLDTTEPHPSSTEEGLSNSTTDQLSNEEKDEKVEEAQTNGDSEPKIDAVPVLEVESHTNDTSKDENNDKPSNIVNQPSNNDNNDDDDDDEKDEKEKEGDKKEQSSHSSPSSPTSTNTESMREKLRRCLCARIDPPLGTKDPDVNVEEGEELVGFLNCHIFEGTYVGTFYRKIVYEDQMRADAIVRYILESKASVFMLAEVWSARLRDRIIKGVFHEYKHSYFPVCGGFGKLDSGLIFLSKKKIAGTGFRAYTDLSSWDRGSTKGIAYIITEDGVAYFTTHLNAGGSTEAKRCRNENIKQMFEFYDDTVDGKNARKTKITKVVFTGDFNIRESDFTQLQHVHNNAANSDEMVELMAKPRQDYENIRGLMEKKGDNKRGLVDGLRVKYGDHLEEPCLTADHTYNSLAVLWTPGDMTRSRLDYFFIKGFDVRDSGAYFHWWAGENADDEARQREGFVLAFEGPKKGRLVPVSDHYGVWIILKPKATTN